MMWYLQLLVELVAFGLASDAVLNVIFATLALFAGFGGRPKTCAALTAALHLALVVM